MGRTRRWRRRHEATIDDDLDLRGTVHFVDAVAVNGEVNPNGGSLTTSCGSIGGDLSGRVASIVLRGGPASVGKDVHTRQGSRLLAFDATASDRLDVQDASPTPLGAVWHEPLRPGARQEHFRRTFDVERRCPHPMRSPTTSRSATSCCTASTSPTCQSVAPVGRPQRSGHGVERAVRWRGAARRAGE